VSTLHNDLQPFFQRSEKAARQPALARKYSTIYPISGLDPQSGGEPH
jgi:hypothetical protein